jgi:hypothetical protein
MSDIIEAVRPADAVVASLITEVTKKQTQAILNIGHSKLAELLRDGELDAVRDGPKTLVTIASIKRYQAKRPRADFSAPHPRFVEMRAMPRKRGRQSRKTVTA